MMTAASPSLIFFDIDGTLVVNHDKIPQSALDAIADMRANGHFAILNTGRPMAMIKSHLLEGPFDGIVAACGTHIVWRGETLLNVLMDAELVSQSIALLTEHAVNPWFEGPEHVYLKSLRPDGIMADILRFFEDVPGVLAEWTQTPIQANKISCLLPENGSLNAQHPFMERHFTWINHGPDFCELVPKGYTKATGIRFLLEHLDLPHERTYAFGDSMNDIDMLSFARYGIAMGGSREQVIQVSDHVTDSPEEDGIANALRHFGLIR